MQRRIVLPAVAATLAIGLAPMTASHAAGSATAKPAKATAAASAAAKYTVTTLDFHVTVPNEAVGGTGTQSCLIVGDLYRPAGATAKHRVPAILTTNGFGGSKADQDYIGEIGAERATPYCPTPGWASAAPVARSPSTTRRTTVGRASS